MTTGAQPDISVVIPTKDRLPIVRRAIECALAQDDVDVEVIVVDDGGTDGTFEALAAASEPRLRLLQHEHSKGPAAARNLGLASARGAWSAFLDDDDLWAPQKLRAQLDAANVTDAGFAFADTLVVDDRLVPMGYDRSPIVEGLLVELLKHNSVPGGCSNVIARTDVVRRLGGFDERLRVLADWDLWIRLAETTSAARVGEPLVAYVEHHGGLHVEGARAGLDELDYMRRKFRALTSRHGVDMGAGAWFPLWFAAGTRNSGRRASAIRLYLQIALRYRSVAGARRALFAPFTARLAQRDVAGSLTDPGTTPQWLVAFAERQADG